MRLVNNTGNFLIGTTVDSGHRLRVAGNLSVTGYIETDPTYCSAGANTDVLVSENSTINLGFNVKLDPQGSWNQGTKLWTPTIPGVYMVNLQVKWNAGTSTTSQMNIQILKNDNTVGITQDAIPAVIGKTQNLTVMVEMNGSTDSIKFTAYSSNAGGQTVVGEALGSWTYFTAYRIT